MSSRRASTESWKGPRASCSCIKVRYGTGQKAFVHAHLSTLCILHPIRIPEILNSGCMNTLLSKIKPHLKLPPPLPFLTEDLMLMTSYGWCCRPKKRRRPMIYGICLTCTCDAAGVLCEMLGGDVSPGHWNPYIMSETYCTHTPWIDGSTSPGLWSVCIWN